MRFYGYKFKLSLFINMIPFQSTVFWAASGNSFQQVHSRLLKETELCNLSGKRLREFVSRSFAKNLKYCI